MTDDINNPLYRAVLAEPHCDTARLVYADWCDENDLPDRAEYIRLQIQAEFCRDDHTKFDPISDRCRELRERNLDWFHLPCPDCVPDSKQFPTCPTCYGYKSLTEMGCRPNRGFISLVNTWISDLTQVYSRGRRVEWQARPWIKEVVRSFPITEINILNIKELTLNGRWKNTLTREDNRQFPTHVPSSLFDLLEGRDGCHWQSDQDSEPMVTYKNHQDLTSDLSQAAIKLVKNAIAKDDECQSNRPVKQLSPSTV